MEEETNQQVGVLSHQRKYMKIPEEDENLIQNNAFLREIKQVKEGVRTREELGVI